MLLAFITSQSQILQRALLPVNNTNNQNIPNPWSGGLNACQLSEIDLNLDGTKDLLFLNAPEIAFYLLLITVSATHKLPL